MRFSQRNRSLAGVSLLELMIAMTLLAVLGASTFLTSEQTITAFRGASTSVELETSTSRSLDEIIELLRGASPATLAVTPTRIDFQRPQGIAGTAVVWGPPERIEFEYGPADPNDGIDNDGNGLIDEARVIWMQDPGLPTERTRSLSRWVNESAETEIAGNGLDDDGNGLVDETGLWFTLDGKRVTVGLTRTRRGPKGGMQTTSFIRTVSLRNP